MRKWVALIVLWLATLPAVALAQEDTPIPVVVTVILVPASPTPTETPLPPTAGPSPTPTPTPTPTFETSYAFAPPASDGLGGVVLLEVTAGDVVIAMLLFAVLVVMVLNWVMRLRGR